MQHQSTRPRASGLQIRLIHCHVLPRRHVSSPRGVLVDFALLGGALELLALAHRAHLLLALVSLVRCTHRGAHLPNLSLLLFAHSTLISRSYQDLTSRCHALHEAPVGELYP